MSSTSRGRSDAHRPALDPDLQTWNVVPLRTFLAASGRHGAKTLPTLALELIDAVGHTGSRRSADHTRGAREPVCRSRNAPRLAAGGPGHGGARLRARCRRSQRSRRTGWCGESDDAPRPGGCGRAGRTARSGFSPIPTLSPRLWGSWICTYWRRGTISSSTGSSGRIRRSSTVLPVSGSPCGRRMPVV
jgi:hypothetical protein